MTVAILETLMLGSATASASCCLALGARTSWLARGQAVAMVAVMVTVTIADAAVTRYAGALLLLVLAGALVTTRTVGDRCQVEWHRAAGAALMAVALLLHEHTDAMTEHHHHQAAIAAGHYELLLLLRTATLVYLGWTAGMLVRLRHRPVTDLLRWEHMSMGASLAAMVFLMT